VFVASREAHRLCAIDIATGEMVWDFTAGARIDSPPTIHGGRVLFGCRDGYVYSLRATDGALDWRFRAAPEDRRVVACGQLESATPVPGAVLVHGGAACFTAGRSSYLDGGIILYRLDPQTGEVLKETKIYSPDPETGRQPAQYGPNTMPGALADILSADADRLYLRDMAFGKDGSSLDGDVPHLLTLTGFLDDSWAHRSYWVYGTNCSIATGCSSRQKTLTYGRLLSLGESAVYGYGRGNVHWSDQLEDGSYRLFARDRMTGTDRWERSVPIHARAMALAGRSLFVAGPAVANPKQPAPLPDASLSFLVAVSAEDGSERERIPIDGVPVFDGMAAADGMLFIATESGKLLCLGDALAP
jgi:outer membrane protein assembly factor BamB